MYEYLMLIGYSLLIILILFILWMIFGKSENKVLKKIRNFIEDLIESVFKISG